MRITSKILQQWLEESEFYQKNRLQLRMFSSRYWLYDANNNLILSADTARELWDSYTILLNGFYFKERFFTQNC